MAKKLEQLLTSFLPGQGACRTISGPRCAHKKNLVYLRRSKEVVQKLQNRSRGIQKWVLCTGAEIKYQEEIDRVECFILAEDDSWRRKQQSQHNRC